MEGKHIFDDYFSKETFFSNLAVLNWKHGIIYVIHVTEYDKTRNILWFQHIRHTNKSKCMHILKYYSQIVQNDYFPIWIRPNISFTILFL